ncbi:MAG: hypothetical protein ACE5O2_17840, partial [Armatimonadota bacterium]
WPAVFLGGLVVLFGMGVAGPARAVPAFARKYGTSCSRCHVAFPKLNAYGEAFKLRGYHTLGEEKAAAGVEDTRDPLLSLLRKVPVSFRVIESLRFDEDTPLEFRGGSSLSFHAGGTLGPNIGFFSEFDLDGFERWQVVASDLGWGGMEPTSLNVVFGNFELVDYVFSQHRTMTRNPYGIYVTNIGGFSLAGQERGVMLYGTIHSGIGEEVVQEQIAEEAAAADVSAEELEALEAELAAAQPPATPEARAAEKILQILQQNQIITNEQADEVRAILAEGQPTTPEPEAEQEEAGPIPGARTSYDQHSGLFWQAGLVNGTGGLDPDVEFENNPHKDVFGRLAHWFGDTRVGVLGYWGKSRLSSLDGTFENQFRRLGVDVSVYLGPEVNVGGVANRRFNLFGFFAFGRDNNPLAAPPPTPSVRHSGGFVELDCLLSEREMAIARYDFVHSDDLPDRERRELTLNYTYYVRRNVKVSPEVTFDFEGTQGHRLGVGLQSAF